MQLHRPSVICPLALVLCGVWHVPGGRRVERPGKLGGALARLLDATVLCDLACDFQSHGAANPSP
jgi:hypothetical protein